jgi:hypothetical protein
MLRPIAKLSVLWLVLLVTSLTRPWQAQESKSSPEEILTNETIVALSKAGLSPAIIVNKIQTSRTNFDVSITELLRLKHENVSNDVMNAMIQVSHGESEKAKLAANARPKADPNDPLSPHDPGIYLLKERKGQREMVQLESSVYTQSKSGGFLKSAMTYGIAKVQSKAVLAGERAKVQIDNGRPAFYFYFEVTNAGLSSTANAFTTTTTSPNEFVLVKTDVKKNSRELVVGQFNAFGGQSGTLDKYARVFNYEKLGPGIYKVSPKDDLDDGEYCFFYGGSTPMAGYGFFSAGGGQRVFDFGIKESQPR